MTDARHAGPSTGQTRDRYASPPWAGQRSDYLGDDVTLMSALRAGDESAFGWLLDRYDG